ncbi:Peptidoglycan O-acetyltransferase [Maioricimonas rarisocia]|uniref:Peptidoglycan O-acetyltransferase n=1 Tax=Maioricimonas rarisocia TaxID=2528026 RepID=A0A517Z8H9_9PLAN|nr:MBOAT family O-acyltransferase [Maioricimonas rarisocia]QDU38792.1 Peptidoglycan O-acetyltransferase [Maioricimonas rarisocia]
MLFNSFAFWTFYVVLFVVYHKLRHRGQNVLLLAGSYFFYGCWDWRFLGLILLSTVIDYSVALGIGSSNSPWRRRLLLSISIAANLGILGFFKYYGFFAGELERLLTSLGAPALLPTLDIVLPVGISFYTFQTMSYTIDVYRKDCPPTQRLLDFAVYVSFFPQLVAGPIERASRFLPQVLGTRRVDEADFRTGLYLVASGLFRKVVVADNMAPVVNAIFSTPYGELTGAEVLLGVYAFAFQIYGDFSGYSAIARGVARWLGFDLMVNFRMPYFADSPSDFWRRWHISLSGWLRDYLYIPLGGNRGRAIFTYRNLMLTMLLGGLWHGAAWTFIAWGLYHGLLLCVYRVFDQRTPAQDRPQGTALHAARVVLMFHLTCLGWLLFRAESLTQVMVMLQTLAVDFTVTPLAAMTAGLLSFYAGPLMLFEFWLERRREPLSLLNVHWLLRGVAYLYVVYMMLFFPPPVPSEFIYFQF